MTDQRHEFENGKYTLVRDDEYGQVSVLRYGEPWREFVGDSFIYLLVSEFFEHKVTLERARELSQRYQCHPVVLDALFELDKEEA